MTATERRYDVDWLRVIAIGLLLIYHIAIAFQPWGVFIGFIQSAEPIEALWPVMSMLNVWRIPLLFYVSGMGVAFAIRKRNWGQLMLERAKRILLPFLFGMVAIVPLHILMWQKYYSQDLTWSPGPGHLWFLGNIFIYVVLLSPLFLLFRNRNSRIMNGLEKLYSSPPGVLLITIPFILETLLLNPEQHEAYAMTLHGFLLGFLAFFFGFTFVQAGSAFWKTVLKWRWAFLGLGAILYTIRLLIYKLQGPNFLMAIESNCWIFAVFGFGHRYLNRPGKALNYLSQGAYPIYIIHMVFLYLACRFVFPMELSAALKLLLVIGLTVAGCFISYELIIRRISILRLVFGLKNPV